MLVLEKDKTPLHAAVDSVFDKNTADFWLQKLNPLWSVYQPLGKIIKKEHVAHDLVSLTLQVNRHFNFGEAGQHHPIYVVVDGVRYERSYSLTRVDAQHMLLSVKKVENGLVSTQLTEHTQVGDILEFGQPFGDMTLAQTQKSLLLLAAGSGITPMLSMLEARAVEKTQNSAPIELMYWVKTAEDAAFKQRFEQLKQSLPHFNFQIFYTQQGDARLNQAQVEQCTGLSETTVYACGPSGFVTTVETLFVSAAQLKTEAFSLSELASDEEGFIQVTLTQSNQTISIPKGQSILVGLEQQNIKPKHGCRMGICNKCACNKVEGATKNLVNGTQNKEPGNLLKICVNSAQSDLVIDL
jgi:stearoyl-CoA 9-desaturase NADPH oxidoreductase